MECSSCGFENRIDARFCKRCGRPLRLQAASAMHPSLPGAVCPACGATAKPGARYCPRCGRALLAAPAASSLPPTQLPTLPSMPPAAQPPLEYAAAPAQAASTATTGGRVPRWLWWVGGAAVFLGILAVVIAGVVFIPRLVGGGVEPIQTPEPTGTSTTEAPPTQPRAETTQPSPEPVRPEPTLLPQQPVLPVADVSIVPSTFELRPGELLTVTVTATNTSTAPFVRLHYLLEGDWEPTLRGVAPRAALRPEIVEPGTGRTVTFVLEAVQAGTASLRATVTMESPEDPSRLLWAVSESISIAVVE